MNFFKSLTQAVDFAHGVKDSGRERSLNHTQTQIEAVGDKMIREAGLDYDSRPIIVLYACVLPSEFTSVELDGLLAYIRHRLDQFVENDYVVVLFANPLDQRPPWSWLIKAYKSLSREYKKNLKKLYVVHPSSFTKFLLRGMSALVSPKFAMKLVYVPTLSQLASHVPFHQLHILEPIFAHNLNFEAQLQLPKHGPTGVKAGCRVFGRPLEELMGNSGDEGLPKVITDCFEYLLKPDNLVTEGLFRRSPSSNAIMVAKDAYEWSLPDINLDTLGGAHVAAALLKVFLRDLPEPLLPRAFYDAFKQIYSLCRGDCSRFPEFAAKFVLTKMKVPSRQLFLALLRFLYSVQGHSAYNLMTAHNLAVVFTPNLVRSTNPVEDLVMVATGSPGFFFVKECIIQCDRLERP